MGQYADKAVQLFQEGYNCSQAVFAAFADKYGIDRELALRLSASFGGGMGRMREVCGAVSGMLLTAGLETGAVEGSDREGKAANYKEVQALAEQFRKENGSIICRELLGLKPEGGKTSPVLEGGKASSVSEDAHMSPIPEERTEQYYKKRPCLELVRCAAEILEERYLR